jgi:hypothetical protein
MIEVEFAIESAGTQAARVCVGALQTTKTGWMFF